MGLSLSWAVNLPAGPARAIVLTASVLFLFRCFWRDAQPAGRWLAQINTRGKEMMKRSAVVMALAVRG